MARKKYRVVSIEDETWLRLEAFRSRCGLRSVPAVIRWLLDHEERERA